MKITVKHLKTKGWMNLYYTFKYLLYNKSVFWNQEKIMAHKRGMPPSKARKQPVKKGPKY